MNRCSREYQSKATLVITFVELRAVLRRQEGEKLEAEPVLRDLVVTFLETIN